MTKVMVVDDDPDMKEMLDLMMQKEGFETEMAEDGADFLSPEFYSYHLIASPLSD